MLGRLKEQVDIVSIAPDSPDPGVIDQTAALIRNGGLVVFPTNTFYGLGALALDSRAVEKVFRAKERQAHKPLLVLVASREEISSLVASIPDSAQRLMDAFWPGGMTLVFQAKGVFPMNITGHTGKIGIRQARHPVASALVKTAGSPITATSANLSGKAPCSDVNHLDNRIRDRVDLVLDCGKLPGEKGSTVVDVTLSPPKVLREGVIGVKQMEALLAG